MLLLLDAVLSDRGMMRAEGSHFSVMINNLPMPIEGS